MAKKRITELAAETTLKDGQYVAIDHATDGTKKYDFGGALIDLKEEINDYAVCPNLIGMDSDVFYPVEIQATTDICISTYDGSENISEVYLQLFDSTKTEVQSSAFPVGYTSKYFTVQYDVAFIKWNREPSSILQVNIGQVPKTYVPYYKNAKWLSQEINDLSDYISGNLSDLIINKGDITEYVSIVNNYYINASGGLSYTLNAGTTEHIPIKSDEYVCAIIKTNGTNWIANAYYDEDGTFLLRETNSTAYKTQSGYNYLIILAPSIPNAKTVRLSFGAGYSDYIILKGNVSDYKPFNIRSVNHRGYQDVAPENTIPAFKLSKQMGFEWIETDIQKTSDDVYVLLHDLKINRTARNADGSAISSDININDITYAQALTYDFGIWKGSQYAGTTIPTLEEGLEFCKKVGLNIRLELKEVYTSDLSDIISLIEKYSMESNVELVTFASNTVGYIIENYPQYKVGILSDTIDATLLAFVAQYIDDKSDLICGVSKNNTDALFESLKQAGVSNIDVYTISTVNDACDINLYATSATTNKYDVGLLLYILSIFDL